MKSFIKLTHINGDELYIPKQDIGVIGKTKSDTQVAIRYLMGGVVHVTESPEEILKMLEEE